MAVERQEENMDVEKSVDELFDKVEKFSKERERSRSPRDKEALRRSEEMARRLDGMPVPTQVEVNKESEEATEVDMDAELLAEEFNEKMLTPEEKKQFDEAKDKALMVWIDNQAWNTNGASP